MDRNAIMRVNNTKEADIRAVSLSGTRQFTIIGNITDTTCKLCASRIGKVYTLSEITEQSIFPPFHPNCRCKLVDVVTHREIAAEQGKPTTVAGLPFPNTELHEPLNKPAYGPQPLSPATQKADEIFSGLFRGSDYFTIELDRFIGDVNQSDSNWAAAGFIGSILANISMAKVGVKTGQYDNMAEAVVSEIFGPEPGAGDIVDGKVSSIRGKTIAKTAAAEQAKAEISGSIYRYFISPVTTDFGNCRDEIIRQLERERDLADRYMIMYTAYSSANDIETKLSSQTGKSSSVTRSRGFVIDVRNTFVRAIITGNKQLRTPKGSIDSTIRPLCFFVLFRFDTLSALIVK